MIDYFRRNGVLLSQLTEDTAGYKKGDLVIDMAQAKRGYANHVLYKGSNESEWPAMYAELVVNFPAMRGFKADAIYKAGQFDGKLGPVTISQAPRTTELGKQSYYIISNNSLSAVQAVNYALKNGKSVYLTDDGFVVDQATIKELTALYPLFAQSTDKKPIGQTMKAKKIYAPGNPNRSLGFSSVSEATLGLVQMGFEVVTNIEDADVIVLDSDQFDKDILGKKPIIIMGGSAMARLEELGLLTEFDAAMTNEEDGYAYEGLMNISLDDSNPYTSGYNASSLFYSNSGSWIEAVPAGFTRLASIVTNNFYIAGWCPSYEGLAGKTVAISGTYMEQPLFIFAGNPLNKTHTIHFYRWVSNAIFGTDLTAFADESVEKPGQSQVIHHDGEQKGDVQLVSVTSPTTAVSEASAATLPSTGQEDSTMMTISGFLLLFGSFYLNIRRRESKN